MGFGFFPGSATSLVGELASKSGWAGSGNLSLSSMAGSDRFQVKT
jgi:hypothetical protein